MEDHFYQKMYSDLLKPSGKAVEREKDKANTKTCEKKEKTKYKSYHAKLLERHIREAFQSRGKMQKYVDYNAYNSDDDSQDDDPSNLTQSTSLFQRYGLESRLWTDIALTARSRTDALPKWSKHTIAKNDTKTVKSERKRKFSKHTANNR